MPGIDFDRLRAEISIEQVLQLLNFRPLRGRGPQQYGWCPLNHCPPSRRPCFSVNVELGRYYCHRCHRSGHQIQLWAAATGLPLHHAAIDLCRTLRHDIPWIRHW